MKPSKNDAFFDQLQQTGQFLFIRFVKRLHKSRDPLWEGDEIALRMVDRAIKELTSNRGCCDHRRNLISVFVDRRRRARRTLRPKVHLDQLWRPRRSGQTDEHRRVSSVSVTDSSRHAPGSDTELQGEFR
jgi:hypothetical protein